MTRQYTQQDLQQMMEAEKQLGLRGLIVNEADGKEDFDHNFEQISSYFDLNTQTPITVENIVRACEQMQDRMHWKSKPQMEYDSVYGSLTADQKNSFGSWWHTTGRKTIVTDGDQGFENAVKIIKWSKGRAFSQTTFDLAVTNLASTKGLHFRPVQAAPDPRQHSADSGSFMPKTETNLSPRDHAARAKARTEATPAPASEKKSDAWETFCRNMLQHGTHGCQAAMAELFNQRGSKTWRELHREMDQVKKSYERLVRY